LFREFMRVRTLRREFWEEILFSLFL
jgi:hypothetical protein